MSSFWISFNAVIPFVLYLSYGWAARRAGITDADILKKMNKVTFRCFYPLLMFENMYSMGGSYPLSRAFTLLAMGSLALSMGLAACLIPRILKDPKQIPVMIQGIYRSNILLFALPLVENLFGSSEAHKAAALLVIVVPVYNISATIFLELYSDRGKTSPAKFLYNILTTPLVAGALVGMAFVLLKIPVAPQVMKVIENFSDLTTPLALFILGGTLQFESLGKHLKMLTAALFVKMFCIPALLLVPAVAAGIPPIERFLLTVALYATPVATASFPMAQAYDADADLAGEQVVYTTLAAVPVIFLWIMFLASAGLL